jgi:ABC-type sugar transport system, ATPase component
MIRGEIMPNGNVLLRVQGVGKQFEGNRVLKNINFSLEKGKILGLVGENGAGKSTLMKIIFGMNEILSTGGYEGEIYLDGVKIDFKSPLDALNAGIGMVHQEFSLIPGFTASENILLNMENTRPSVISKIFGKKLETLDRKMMKENARRAIDTLGVQLNPDTLIVEMPVGHKQFIEIAREIQREKVKLLVLDEPTAVLTESEAEVLLRAIRKLAGMGVSIIFISHRLNEIISVCDNLVVLRDGAVVVERPVEGVDVRQIAEWMVGRGMEDAKPENVKAVDISENNTDTILDVKHLWVDMPGETVKDVSFSVKRGEIFGIGGLAGQGKLGISNGIHGLYPAGGMVTLNKNNLPLNSTLNTLQSGLSFVSEDRRGVGLLLDEPIDWNITFNAMQVQDKFIKKLLFGIIKWRDDKAMKKCAEKYIGELDIKCTSSRQYARQLSGGNQQKLCLAKAFAMEPDLLFVSEPTRGIDVGAKALVLDALRRCNRENNTTIVMVSSELQELRSICDRIAIVSEGKISGILPPDASPAEFGLLMSGLNNLSEEGEKR